jgi:hypothetical protein
LIATVDDPPCIPLKKGDFESGSPFLRGLGGSIFGVLNWGKCLDGLVNAMVAIQTDLGSQTRSLYDRDFVRWTEQVAAALRQGDWAALDVENLIEEVEALGKSDRRAIKSRLEVLLMHLLKWQFQPEQRSRSWQATILEQRLRIADILEDSPSLKNYLPTVVDAAYVSARQLASIETGLAVDQFPVGCEYTIGPMLDAAYLPE